MIGRIMLYTAVYNRHGYFVYGKVKAMWLHNYLNLK